MPVPGVLIVLGGIDNLDEVVTVETPPTIPREVSVVIAGHLHQPFIIRMEQGVWVNAGSVGRPCDGNPSASFVILEEKSESWRVSLRRVPFDLEVAAQAIWDAQMPYAERLVETQRKATWW